MDYSEIERLLEENYGIKSDPYLKPENPLYKMGMAYVKQLKDECKNEHSNTLCTYCFQREESERDRASDILDSRSHLPFYQQPLDAGYLEDLRREDEAFNESMKHLQLFCAYQIVLNTWKEEGILEDKIKEAEVYVKNQ